MPRMRNMFDYFDDGESSQTQDERMRPNATLVEVQQNDSVKTITVHLEPRQYVQMRRNDDGWEVVTNLNVIQTRGNAAITKG